MKATFYPVTESESGPRPSALTSGSARRWITALSIVTAALALVATAVGILTFNNQHHVSFVSLRGEAVSLQGAGLYAHESVSMAAQAVGQDIVTLMIWIPVLLISTYLAAKGSLRGQLLQVGVLAYFAYTYLIIAFGGAYNPFFLIYVAIFSASLFALTLSVSMVDITALPEKFSPRFHRQSIASLMLFEGAVLLLMWLGRIVPSLVNGTPPAGLESYTTLTVQAADLGIVVPLAIIAGVTMFQGRAWSYLLSTVLAVYGTAFGLALIGMMVAMTIAGTSIPLVEAIGFATLAALFLVGAIHVFASLRSRVSLIDQSIPSSRPARWPQ